MLRLRAASLLLVCLLAMGCRPAYLAFRIPAEEFGARVRVLCLRDPSSELDLEAWDERKSALARELGRELRRLDFEVVEAAAVREVWERERSAGEALYDIHSGDPIEPALDAFEQRAMAALRRTHHCDGIVESRVSFVRAQWVNGIATWDGVQRKVATGLGASNAMGWVSALSLHVSIEDLDGKLLYFGTGGIEALARFHARVFGRDEIKPADSDHILADAAWRDQGIRAALEALGRTRRVASASAGSERTRAPR